MAAKDDIFTGATAADAPETCLSERPVAFERVRRAGLGSLWRLMAILVVILSASVPAVAQDSRAAARLDGRVVFRLGPTADMDAEARARQVERRMAALLEQPQAIAPARVEISGDDQRDRLITVAAMPVVTVTQADAEDNLTTVDVLSTQWAGAIDRALQQARERRLGWGGRFIAETRSAIETAFARLYESILRVVPRALAAVLVIMMFWGIAAAVRRLMRLVFQRIVDDLTVENLIEQVAYYAVWVLGLIVAVDALGFDPETVVTGLGLTGLALGFALRDIISNFISGVLILALRPFRLNDQIDVGETEGNVERIELRATQIRTYDGRLVLVPNAEVFTSRITNNTASPIRRGSVTVFLGYDSDLEVVQAVIRNAAQAAEGVLPQPPPSVRVRELGPDDIEIEARFWTDSRRSDVVGTASAVRRGLVAALRAAEIALPDPAVRLIVPETGIRPQPAPGSGKPRNTE